jgi:hypothetical protein
LTLANIKWAFTTLNGDTSYWHPLTWISHQLDCQLFGAAAGAHHLTNVLLHVANVVLVFLFLNRASQRRAKSAFAAAIFAVHPLHLESVLWIAERKDLLCGVFYFLALLTYLSYARKRGLWRYLLTLFFFACSLLSKPMAVTLPCILLLLDIWPLARFQQPVKTIFDRLRTGQRSSERLTCIWGTSDSPSTRQAANRLFWLCIAEKVPFFIFSVSLKNSLAPCPISLHFRLLIELTRPA